MTEKKFAKGVKVTSKKFDNGNEIIKLGINVANFCEQNPINEQGYINIDIKKSKNDCWYAELNTYSRKNNESKNHQKKETEVMFDDTEEIPF